MRYNTGNAVPSRDLRDLDDNSIAFDGFLHSSANFEPDRLGRSRKTWAGMERDAEVLTAPNVSAIANAVSAANKLFYYTDSGVGEMIDFTAQARSFVSATTQGAQRTSLGLGAVAVEGVVPIGKGGTGQIGAPAARDALGVLNVTQTYIDGLQLVWQPNAVFVGIGAAYVPGLGKVVESSSGFTVALSALTANTFYHLYIFQLAGAASVEISSVAPAPYGSEAYTKSGDTSRRYLGSVLANSATTCYRFVMDGKDVLYNVGSIASAPFALVNGTATTDTVVSAASCVPTTASKVKVMVVNGASASTVRLGNPDMGATSSANHRQFVLSGQGVQLDILLSGVSQFSYIFDSAPSGAFTARANGYTLKR